MAEASSSTETTPNLAGDKRAWIVPSILALLIVVLAWLPLSRIPGGATVGPFDQIKAMEPFRQGEPQSSWDILQADGVLQSYAWREVLRSGYSGDRMPYWNHSQLMGTPVLANSQSGAFYPPHMLLASQDFSSGQTILILAWLHLAWAGLGVMLLARRLGASWPGAFLGGAGFTLSTFLLGWLPLASVPTTVSWIPWCLYFAAGLFQPGARPAWQCLGLGFSGAMMILAGHLQFAFYGFAGAFLLALIEAVRAIREKRLGWTSVAGVAGGLALAPLLAAPQLMPVLDYGSFSHRRAPATAEGYKAYVGGALSWWELPGMVFSSAMGFPGAVAPALEKEKGPAYWPAYVRPGAAFAESAWGIGPLAFGLLGLLILRRKGGPGLWAAGGLSVFGLVMALGTPLNALFYFGIPGWSATGSPGRIVVLFVLGACLFCALAWPEGKEEAGPNDLKAALGGLAAAFLLALLIFQAASPGLKSWMEGLNVQALAAGQLQAGLPLAVLSLGLAGAGVALGLRKQPLIGAILAVASQLSLGTAFHVPYGTPPTRLKFEASESSSARTGTERHAFFNSNWGFLQTPKAIAPPNSATILGIEDIAGYDSLLHRDTVALLNEINGRDSAPETNGNIMHIKPGADLKKLSEAGVTRIWLPEGAPAPEGLEALPPDLGGSGSRLQSFDLPGPGLASLTEGSAKVMLQTTEGVDVEVEGKGELIVRYRALPGWSAEVDGKAVPLKSGTWLAIDVPEGAKLAAFRYRPPGLDRGLALFAGGMIAAAIIGLLGLVLPRKAASDGPGPE